MKKISLLTWLSALAFMFVFTSTSCNASKQAAANGNANSSLAAKEKALLWKISGKGLKTSSHLFGTIHMIDAKDYFLPEYVEKAFDKSTNVVFEINTEKMNDMSMMGEMMGMIFMEDGTTLKDLLTEEEYDKVKKNLNENPMMMMMGDMVDKIKPMFLSAMIDQGDAGMDPFGGGGTGMGGSTKSYELELTAMAKKTEKSISGLETVAFQMSMFDSISLEDQSKMLVQALDGGEEGDDMMATMIALYTSQDVPGLYEMISEQSEGSSDFEDKLLTMRNKNWIPLMAEQMPLNPTFFAVGAGHLGGEQGVIALLRKEGYVVTPVLK